MIIKVLANIVIFILLIVKVNAICEQNTYYNTDTCYSFSEFNGKKCCCNYGYLYKGETCKMLEYKELVYTCNPKFLSVLNKATLNKTAKEICFKNNIRYGGLIEGISNNSKELNGCTTGTLLTFIKENIDVLGKILKECDQFFPPPPKPAATMENIFRSYGLKPI